MCDDHCPACGEVVPADEGMIASPVPELQGACRDIGACNRRVAENEEYVRRYNEVADALADLEWEGAVCRTPARFWYELGLPDPGEDAPEHAAVGGGHAGALEGHG